MGKIRINKLALELNIQSDQILDALQKKGHTVKNYMSSIDVTIADEIRELFTLKPASTPKTAKIAKATKAKTATKKAGTKKTADTAKKADTKKTTDTKKDK